MAGQLNVNDEFNSNSFPSSSMSVTIFESVGDHLLLSVLSAVTSQSIPTLNTDGTDLESSIMLPLHSDWSSMVSFSWQTVTKTCGVWQCPFDTHIDQLGVESVECMICLEEVPSTGLLPCATCRQKTCALCFVRIAVASASRHQLFACPLCRSPATLPLYKYMELVVDEHSSAMPADQIGGPKSRSSTVLIYENEDAHASSAFGHGEDDTFTDTTDLFETISIESPLAFNWSEYCLAELNELSVTATWLSQSEQF